MNDELGSSSARATPRLETIDLHAGYGPFEVLHGISLAVPDRAIVTLFGHNGAGKSTLLKAIAGQIPTASGETRFAGRPVVRRDTGATARMGIRYVPHDANVFPNMTVRDNLILGAYANDAGPAELAKQLAVVYALFPALQERERVYARVLSGGQRQMLAISMALMTAPKMLCSTNRRPVFHPPTCSVCSIRSLRCATNSARACC